MWLAPLSRAKGIRGQAPYWRNTGTVLTEHTGSFARTGLGADGASS